MYTGVFSNGMVTKYREVLSPPLDRSPDDLREAIKYLRMAESIVVNTTPESKELEYDIKAIERYIIRRDGLLEYQKRDGSWISDGVWGTLGGLVANASWNGKVALVAGPKNKVAARWPISVDGIPEIKMIRKGNLRRLPFEVPENFFAMTATIEKGIERGRNLVGLHSHAQRNA